MAVEKVAGSNPVQPRDSAPKNDVVKTTPARELPREDGVARINNLSITATVIKTRINIAFDRAGAASADARLINAEYTPSGASSAPAGTLIGADVLQEAGTASSAFVRTPETVANEIAEEYRTAGPAAAAQRLAAELRTSSDPAYRQEIMAALAQKPEAASLLTTAMGSRPVGANSALSAADQRLVAQTFGQAYDAGKIGTAALDKMMQYIGERGSNDGVLRGDYLAKLAIQSGSSQFKTAFVDSIFKTAQQHPVASDYYMSAAARVMTADPAVLQTFTTKLNNKEYGDDITLQHFLETASQSQLDPSNPHSTRLQPAFASNPGFALMDRAERLPFGDAKVAIFRAAATSETLTQRVPGGADQVAQLFNSDPAAFTDYFVREDVDDRNVRVKDFSTFMQNTLFNDNASAETKASLNANIVAQADRLKQDQNYNRLGVLSGTVQRGYEQAIKADEDRKAATKEFIGLLIGLTPVPGKLKEVIVSVLGDVPKAVADGLASAAQGRIESGVVDWLTDRLTDDGAAFGLGGNSVKNVDDLDKILRGMLGVSTLPDPDARSSENEAITDYEAGLTFVRALN